MKKNSSKLRQEVKVNVDIVTSDDIEIYYAGKFQDFTARCIINHHTHRPGVIILRVVFVCSFSHGSSVTCAKSLIFNIISAVTRSRPT